MEKKKTIYHLIVDKSGSMSDSIENTINGFNEQVNRIHKMEKEFTEQEITIGLSTFNQENYNHFFQCPPSAVRKLTTKSYRPDGLTALLDSIGLVSTQIEKDIKEQSEKVDTTVVIVILTDGHENSSRLFKLEDIRKMISRLEETEKWTFSFIGATLDAVSVAESMNIKSQNSFAFDKKDMKKEVWSKLSDSMENYLSKKRNGDDLSNLF